jgi:hypothetical protein
MATIGKKVIGKPRFQRGPISYDVFATVAAGQLVVAGTAGNAGKVGPAGANALGVLGVATTPGMVAGTSQSGTSIGGFPLIDVNIPEGKVAIARRGEFYLAATGTFVFGDFVKAGANGSVVKWDPAVDQAITQVGQCVDVDGATNGAVALIDVNIQG